MRTSLFLRFIIGIRSCSYRALFPRVRFWDPSSAVLLCTTHAFCYWCLYLLSS